MEGNDRYVGNAEVLGSVNLEGDHHYQEEFRYERDNEADTAYLKLRIDDTAVCERKHRATSNRICEKHQNQSKVGPWCTHGKS